MSNVIRMPGKPPGEIKRDCVFRNRSVQVAGEGGEKELFPCIVLYETATDIPIHYTGLERYLCHLAKSQMLDGKTLEARAYAVCHFLNYLLWETDIRSLHECTPDTIRDFLKSSRRKQNGEEYNKDTWLRYRDYLTDFLVLYHEYNQDTLPFRYTGDELRTAIVLRDEQSHRKVAMVYPASLYLKAPRTTHKKNRILVDGYLDLLLYEAKKYEPDIALGIALGAYAGLREGEVVNVSFGAVRTICRGFGIISGVEIDLTDDAPFFKRWDGRTDPGSIKKYRKQRVYEASFRKWFPIYFWVNITFILPLRATEMLVTPKDCIRRTDGGKAVLTIRRTKLKNGKRTVYYDVDRDYRKFNYEIPDNDVAATIEKYIAVTSGQDRRFLFEYSDLMVNGMLSLQAFNHLLAEFMEERIIGSPRYEFAKYAAGIREFEKVTAGDSRPIAMANLYFQNAGEDICRQLADHVHIDTSSGYYTNISETIWASSVIRFQKKMEYERRYEQEMYEKGELAAAGPHSQCLSEKRLSDPEDLDDCIRQGHLADCMGCRFYRPSGRELSDYMEAQKKRADDGAKRVIEFMNSTLKAKKQDISMEELFLSVQTDASRYRMGCDISAKEKYNEWQEHRNSPKTYF